METGNKYVVAANLLPSQYLLAGFLVLMACLVYSNTMNSPFVFDDHYNILANRPLHITEISADSIRGVVKESLLKNRPVANISLALNYYFSQDDVTAYHVFNTFIHAANGVLLYLFIMLTLRLQKNAYTESSSRWLAFAAALIWLVHPLQTQSVTYIIQRMNSMAAMFYLLSIISYIQARTAKKTLSVLLWSALCLSSGLLGIGSKENSAMLPVFIILYEWFFFQDLRFLDAGNMFKSGVVLLILFMIAAVFFYLGPDPIGSVTNYSMRDFTLQERVLTQFRVVVFYISLIFLPSPARLTLEHDFALSRSFLDPAGTLFAFLVLISILLASVIIARRHRIYSFSILWFLGNLFIESSVIPLEIIFEHRTYLPSMLVMLFAVLLLNRVVSSGKIKLLLLVSTLVLLSAWTYNRNSVWADELTLFSDIARKAPDKSRAQMGLGFALSEQNRLDEAEFYMKRAVMLEPGYSQAHIALGDVLMKRNSFARAAEAYGRALKIDPRNPTIAFNLGKALAAEGRHEEALFHFKNIAGMDFLIDHKVYFHMGNSQFMLKRFSEAIVSYNTALLIKPDYFEAMQALNYTARYFDMQNIQNGEAR